MADQGVVLDALRAVCRSILDEAGQKVFQNRVRMLCEVLGRPRPFPGKTFRAVDAVLRIHLLQLSWSSGLFGYPIRPPNLRWGSPLPS